MTTNPARTITTTIRTIKAPAAYTTTTRLTPRSKIEIPNKTYYTIPAGKKTVLPLTSESMHAAIVYRCCCVVGPRWSFATGSAKWISCYLHSQRRISNPGGLLNSYFSRTSEDWTWSTFYQRIFVTSTVLGRSIGLWDCYKKRWRRLWERLGSLYWNDCRIDFRTGICRCCGIVYGT
jgi:hypothetical protein